MQPWYFNHRVILSTAFILRFAVVTLVILFYPERAVLTDSVGYLTIAQNMAEHASFSTSTEAPILPDMMRTPLYPALLYVFQFTGSAKTLMLIFQLVISFLSCYYLIKLTQKITGNAKAAAISGWFMALDILSIVFTGFILTETIFSFLLILFLWHLVHYFENKSVRSILLSSLFLALALLCRPIALFLPVWILLCFILFFRKTVLFKHATFFLLPVSILTGSWILRNYMVFETPFFTRIGTFNVAWFQASMTKAEAENSSVENARWELFNDAAKKMKTLPANDPITFYDELRAQSREVIFDNPGIALKNVVKAEGNLLFRPSTGYISHLLGIADLPNNHGVEKIWPSASIKILVAFQFLLLFLLYAGCIILFFYRKNQTNKSLYLLIFLIFIYFLIPGTGPEMEARFRIPLLPMLSILSASGWIMFIKRKQKNESNTSPC
ncbi:MAG: hypothetical protein ACHQF2_00630 [Flavobacteriales bacterium]